MITLSSPFLEKLSLLQLVAKKKRRWRYQGKEIFFFQRLRPPQPWPSPLPLHSAPKPNTAPPFPQDPSQGGGESDGAHFIKKVSSSSSSFRESVSLFSAAASLPPSLFRPSRAANRGGRGIPFPPSSFPDPLRLRLLGREEEEKDVAFRINKRGVGG